MVRGRYTERQGALGSGPFAMRYRALHHEHSPSNSTLCHRVPATLILRRAGLLLLLTLCPGALAAQARPLVLLTGSEIGTYYRFGQAISRILDSSGTGVRIITKPSNGSVDNLRGLFGGDADLAIVQSDMAYAAARGADPFDHSIGNVQALMGLFYEDLLVIARKDLKLRSASGIRQDLRIVIGARESGTRSNAINVLDAIGLSLTAITPIEMEPRRALPLLAKDSADIVFLTAGLDEALLTTIDSVGAELLPLGPELIATLRRRRPYYEPASIATANGTIPTVRIRAYLVGRQSLTPAEATAVVQSLYEHLTDLRASHPRGAQILPENIAEIRAIPANAAANRYYCSVGRRTCSNTLLWLVLAALLVVAGATTIWLSAPARTWLLRHTPRLSRSLFGPHGVTDRYRFIVIPIMIASIILAGSLVVQRAEASYAQEFNVHSDFEDLGLNENLIWMMVFTATGFEDGRFPQSPTGKVVSAMLNWMSIASILVLIGLLTSDKVARRMKLRLQSHPERLKDHVIVCGWNRRAKTIIAELTTTELGARRQQVAVVCDRSADFMAQQGLDEDVVLHVAGEPTDLAQLERAGLDRAHTVLILADHDAPDSDARSLLTLITIEKRAHRMRRGGERAHALRSVVEILDPQKMQLFQDSHAGLVVCAADFDARLLSNSILNPAVSRFLQGVLTTGAGDEIIEVPVTGRERRPIVGRTFDEVLLECRAEGLLLLAINQGGAPGVLPAAARNAQMTATGTIAIRQELLTNPSAATSRSYPVAVGDSLLFLADSELSLAPVFGDPAEWQAGFAG